MPITVPTEFLGNKGFLGVAPEATYGAATAATSYFPFKSETLAGKPGYKNVPTIRQSRSDYTTKYAGLYDVGGDIVLPMYTTSGMILLAAALGIDTYGGGTHVLTTSEGALPSLTIEKYLAGATDATLAGQFSRQLFGMIVSKAAVKMTVGAEVESTFTLMGQGDNYIAPTTPTFGTDSTPFSLLNISATLDAVASPFITAIDFNLDNSAKAIGTFQGVRNPALVYGGERKVDGKLTVVMQDSTYLRDAFAGSYHALVVTLYQDSTHQAVLTMPNVLFGDTTEPLKLGEIVTQEVPFTAYAIPGSYDLSISLKNDVSSAYF